MKPDEKRRLVHEDRAATQAELLTLSSARTRLSCVPGRGRAARARKCMRQEMATEPSTGSTLEFLKIEWLGPTRSPTADEQRDRSCPMRSWSPRNCARHDSHPGAHAGAIEEKHSAPASRETLSKRTPRQWRARSYLSAPTYSLRCDLVTVACFAQEISTTSTRSSLYRC